MRVSDLLNKSNVHAAVEPSTRKWRERCFRQFAESRTDERLLGDEDAANVAGVVLLDFLASKSDWSANQKNLFARTIRQAFGWAVDVGLITKNPFAAIKFEAGGEGRRPWTSDEYSLAVNRAPKHLRRLIQFLRWTGCRPGEATKLRWTDVCMAANTATLQRHKTFKKTGKPRLIVLLPQALAVLREIAEEQTGDIDGLIFRRPRGGPWTREGMSQQFGILRRKTGLSTECKLHGLRHYFATFAIKKGVPIWVVSKVLGHSSIETTIRCYVKIDDQPEEWLSALEAKLK